MQLSPWTSAPRSWTALPETCLFPRITLMLSMTLSWSVLVSIPKSFNIPPRNQAERWLYSTSLAAVRHLMYITMSDLAEGWCTSYAGRLPYILLYSTCRARAEGWLYSRRSSCTSRAELWPKVGCTAAIQRVHHVPSCGRRLAVQPPFSLYITCRAVAESWLCSRCLEWPLVPIDSSPSISRPENRKKIGKVKNCFK